MNDTPTSEKQLPTYQFVIFLSIQNHEKKPHLTLKFRQYVCMQSFVISEPLPQS